MAVRRTAALLTAAEARLRDYLTAAAKGLDGAKCVKVMDDGRPPPNCGPVFFAIHDGGARGTGGRQQSHALDLLQGVTVTISLKYLAAPTDRAGRERIAAEAGLLDRADEVIELLHGDEGTYGLANTMLASPTGYGWTEPLAFQSRSAVEAKGAEWFWSAARADTQPEPPAGLVTVVSLHGARYLAPRGQTQ